VPGTHRRMSNRDNKTMLAAVNAYQASRVPALLLIPESQIDKNTFNSVDPRVTKGSALGGREIELIGEVFNLFGTDNLGGIDTNQTTNAHPRQQGAIAGVDRYFEIFRIYASSLSFS
jgi:hypothetical protein